MTTEAPVKPIQWKTSLNFKEVCRAWRDGKKGILLEGGTYSSKTWGALQALIHLAEIAKGKLDIDIVSESIPHLKGGCLKDFFNILGERQENNPYFNQTDHIYRRPGWRGVTTFLSADNNKALGMRRDILFINEGDTLSWEIAKELISRTNRFCIIDWNPRSEFWAHEYYLNDPKWAYCHTTYKDALDLIPLGKWEDIVSLGSKDPNYRNIYELGLMGKIEGLIHPNFKQVDELPDIKDKGGTLFYGLDFGFAHDPTVFTKHIIIGENLYSKQMLWDASGLTNDQIAQKMELLKVGREPILADPSEPKSIVEISQKGFNCQEAVKGPGSKAFGIQRVNQFFQHWTKESLECIKEQRNYRYLKDKVTGLFTDKTTHQWSHGMDSRRYGVASSRKHVGGSNVVMQEIR